MWWQYNHSSTTQHQVFYAKEDCTKKDTFFSSNGAKTIGCQVNLARGMGMFRLACFIRGMSIAAPDEEPQASPSLSFFHFRPSLFGSSKKGG